MIKTLLLDTFLLMGIIWMLISIVYFCIRLDRLLSSMEKPVVETMEETAEVVLSEEDISSPVSVSCRHTDLLHPLSLSFRAPPLYNLSDFQ